MWKWAFTKCGALRYDTIQWEVVGYLKKIFKPLNEISKAI